MRRRDLLRTGAAAALPGSLRAGQRALDCECSFQVQAIAPGPFEHVGSHLRVTGMKVFGVSLNRTSDRPYVFVKLETNEGIVGWGEGTLEGKAGAVIACMNDFRDFVIGADPMQVEHIWQSMYVHSFYRAGPVIGSAISGIDQALWDIRGKALGMPVYKLLGGPSTGKNMIVLSDEFYREISSHPIPTDLEAAKALSSSPAALDLFTWLSYRCFTARGPERVPLFGEFGLTSQIGSVEYARPRKFRERLERWLNLIRSMWPECPARISSDGRYLILDRAVAIARREHE